MIKFGTFNILDSEFVYFNHKKCKKSYPEREDETSRNSVLISLFEKNDFDILFLQEVSAVFSELFRRSTILTKKFEFVGTKDMCILIKKSIMSELQMIYNKRYNDDKYVTERIYATICEINNVEFLLINVHLPSGIQEKSKQNMLDMVRDIVTENKMNTIIAGDMNTGKYIMSFLRSKKISSIIDLNIKKQYTTSFKLGKCYNNEFKQSNKNERHFFIDDIYVSDNLKVDDVKIISSFDNQYNFITDSPQHNFKDQGAPFCDPNIYSENGFCEISQYKKVHMWPSDHALVCATIRFESNSLDIGSLISEIELLTKKTHEVNELIKLLKRSLNDNPN